MKKDMYGGSSRFSMFNDEIRHNSYADKNEEVADSLTEWMIAIFMILFLAGVIIGNHYGFNPH